MDKKLTSFSSSNLFGSDKASESTDAGLGVVGATGSSILYGDAIANTKNQSLYCEAVGNVVKYSGSELNNPEISNLVFSVLNKLGFLFGISEKQQSEVEGYREVSETLGIGLEIALRNLSDGSVSKVYAQEIIKFITQAELNEEQLKTSKPVIYTLVNSKIANELFGNSLTELYDTFCSKFLIGYVDKSADKLSTEDLLYKFKTMYVDMLEIRDDGVAMEATKFYRKVMHEKV